MKSEYFSDSVVRVLLKRDVSSDSLYTSIKNVLGFSGFC